MFDFCNSFYTLNSSIYRDLMIANLVRKKENVQKELKNKNNNIWNIKEVSSKACQTSPRKCHDKGCQTDIYVPKSLSEAIYNHMQESRYNKHIYYDTQSSSSEDSSIIDIDADEPIEFIMLDA